MANVAVRQASDRRLLFLSISLAACVVARPRRVWRIVDNRADDEKASDVSNKFYFCLLHGTQLKARASGPVKACGHDTVESPQVSAEAMAAARPAAHAHDPSAHDLTP